jgi:LysM repeat protein
MNLYDFFSNNKKLNIKENIPTANEVEKQVVNENLHKWFKEKWVRFGPDGKIRGDCARGDDSEGKPKCLPRAKAHSLGKKGRASAAARKRREDPNPERSGSAINVPTKSKRKIDEQSARGGMAAPVWGNPRSAPPAASPQVVGSTGAGARAARAADTTAAARTAPSVDQSQRRGAMPRVGTDSYYVPGAEPDARSLARQASLASQREQEAAQKLKNAAATAAVTTPPQIVGSTGAGARAARAADTTAAARTAPSVDQSQRRGKMPRVGTGSYYVPGDKKTEPTDDQLAAAANVATGGYSGGESPPKGKMPRVGTDFYYVPGDNIEPDARNQARLASQAIQRDTEAQQQARIAAREKEYAASSDQEDTDLATAMNKMAADLAKTASTDDQLAAAADVATGGYSGGKSQPSTVSTPSSYTIRSGDTLSQLASRFGTTTQELMRLNPDIKDPNKIYAGTSLNILKPEGSSDQATGIKPGPNPNIDDETRRRARQAVAPDQSSAETQRLANQPVRIIPGTVGTASGQLLSGDGTPVLTGYASDQEAPARPPVISRRDRRADRAGGSADLAGGIGGGQFSDAGKPPVKPSSARPSVASDQTASASTANTDDFTDAEKFTFKAEQGIKNKKQALEPNNDPKIAQSHGVPIGVPRLGAATKDTGNSTSYGLFGINNNRKNAKGEIGQSSIDSFLRINPDLKSKLPDPGSPDDPNQVEKFNQAWWKLAKEQPQTLLQAQLKYHQQAFVQPEINRLKKSGISDNIANDSRVQTYLIDRGVQYGPDANNYVVNLAKNARTPKEFLDIITNYDIDPKNLRNRFKKTYEKNPNEFEKIKRGLINRIEKRRGLISENSVYKINEQGFQFSPEQEKWLGGANRQDPYIIARMPGPKPPAEYFTNPEDQRVAQQIVRSQDLANKWQEFRQGGSLASKAVSRIPGVSQAANVVDIGANLAKGDLPAAGRQALGMIPAARPINLALQAGDVASNLQQGNLAAGAKGALGIAAGTGSETAGQALKGWNLFNRLQKTTQSLADKQNQSTMENTCPQCGGLSVDDEMLAEKKDACYHKVKSRYKVWPSAYASGALVKCRKKGAKNWGKSKANEDSNLYFNITGTDKKTLISEFKLNRNNKGWYLKEDSPSSVKLDAIRAFGMPLSEEELNPTAYSGTAATIGVDNPRSPVGSVPKSQRINSKQKGKK